MKLLLDVGNTRVKWAMLEKGVPGAACARERTGDDAALLGEIAAGLPAPESVFICSVAGTRADEAARSVCRRLWDIEPVFAASVREAAGVRNAYRDPAQLGTDRWLAMLAAVQRYGRPLCLVSFGTAVTVDAVDARGNHLGGFIVPGTALMARALAEGTQLRPGITEAADRLGLSTDECIANGALAAVAALADRAFGRVRAEHGDAVRCVVTGGAAPALIPVLETGVAHDPDLVLAGLALLAEEDGKDAGRRAGGG